MRSIAGWIALLLIAGGCRCDDGWRSSSTGLAGFQLSPRGLDFGRVLEGGTAAQTLTVVSTARTGQTIRLVTAPPFEVEPALLDLGPGMTGHVEVRFHAGATVADGAVLGSSGREQHQVALHGVGVRPLDCVPSAPCRVASFDLQSGTCVETSAADGVACESTNLCVVNGACRGGLCLGDVRSCDDADRCTNDGCAPELGCLHTRVRCPRTTNPCQAPSCDTETGCGFANLPDFTSCGNFTCIEGSFCVAGSCQVAPTPDGFPCAPPSPCQGAGVCTQQECLRPDAGTLAATFSLPLPAGPAPGDAPGLVASEGNLFVELCDEDGGGCAVSSWTGNGFERFMVRHEDAGVRRVMAATPEALWVRSSGEVELRDPGTGAAVRSYPLLALAAPGGAVGGTAVTARGGFAVDADGGLWLSLGWAPEAGDAGDAGEPDAGGADAGDAGELDAGGADAGDAGEVDAGDLDAGVPFAPSRALVWLPPDGGSPERTELTDWTAPPELAFSADGALLLHLPWERTALASVDGGVLDAFGWDVADDAGPGLAVGVGYVLTGGAQLFAVDGGGAFALADAGVEGEPVYPDGDRVLLTRTASFGLYRACTTPFTEPCADNERSLYVRAFEPSDGGTLWRALVLGYDTPGSVEQLANVDGGLAVLTQVFPDGGGPELRLQGFFDGDEYLNCPLEGGGVLGAAVFEGSFLYAITQRDGGWTLDAYDFTGAPFDYSGWSMPGGVGGTRRARP